MVPESELSTLLTVPIFRLRRAESAPISGGRVPVMLFPEKSTCVRCTKVSRLDGIVPVSKSIREGVLLNEQ
jgi:hypothetical protein